MHGLLPVPGNWKREKKSSKAYTEKEIRFELNRLICIVEAAREREEKGMVNSRTRNPLAID